MFMFLNTLGFDAFLEDAENRTPFYYTVKYNNFPVCKYLWTNGGNMENFNYKGLHPLHLAAKNGNIDFVDFIIRTGVDANQYDENVSLIFLEFLFYFIQQSSIRLS